MKMGPTWGPAKNEKGAHLSQKQVSLAEHGLILGGMAVGSAPQGTVRWLHEGFHGKVRVLGCQPPALQIGQFLLPPLVFLSALHSSFFQSLLAKGWERMARETKSLPGLLFQ